MARRRWARTTKPKTIDGTPYRSKFEVAIAADLTARGVSFDYEALKLRYVTEHTYKPDFSSGSVVIEAKGYFTSADRSKLLAVKEAHPELDLRLLFQRASNKLSKESETTYADWAEQHGFQWAEGRVPEEWLRPLPRKSRRRGTHSLLIRSRSATPNHAEAAPMLTLCALG
ncbi:Phage endonuclease I [Enhydrobacter aerosaccus]|uniref:Phage endonuclease I n=1 Tax=Enhydrobacter aerosaccus TaxID=225324 RepID=A0A1T4RP50_9HYPH|nr:Phage endonuclease I [Enhydrobacter aerosaccus]